MFIKEINHMYPCKSKAIVYRRIKHDSFPSLCMGETRLFCCVIMLRYSFNQGLIVLSYHINVPICSCFNRLVLYLNLNIQNRVYTSEKLSRSYTRRMVRYVFASWQRTYTKLNIGISFFKITEVWSIIL